MRAFVPLVLVLVLLAACGGKIAPGPVVDGGMAVELADDSDSDSDTACTRPRALRLSHSCPTSCATTSTPNRAFASPGELLDFLPTHWIACSVEADGLPFDGITFHDGCSFSWLVHGKESQSGTFAVEQMGTHGAEIVLHTDGGGDEHLAVSMSECPNQLRIVRNAQTIYFMAAH